MNEQFYSLPEEKQLRIINSSLEVFGKNDYKRAVTDDIAVKAGISKGLLFYYFKNKKNLYIFLIKYCEKIIIDEVIDENLMKITDFFQLLEYGAEKKCSVLSKYPYMYEFSIRAYFSSIEEVNGELYKKKLEEMSNIRNSFFKNIDFKKFKEGVNIEKLVNILIWAMTGYYTEQLRMNSTVNLEDIMKEYREWLVMLKKMAYKEEYI